MKIWTSPRRRQAEVYAASQAMLQRIGVRKPPFNEFDFFDELGLAHVTINAAKDESLTPIRDFWMSDSACVVSQGTVSQAFKTHALTTLVTDKSLFADISLDPASRRWSAMHTASHRCLTWYRNLKFGDTISSISPTSSSDMEIEARVFATYLLKLGPKFFQVASNMSLTLDSVRTLAEMFNMPIEIAAVEFLEARKPDEAILVHFMPEFRPEDWYDDDTIDVFYSPPFYHQTKAFTEKFGAQNEDRLYQFLDLHRLDQLPHKKVVSLEGTLCEATVERKEHILSISSCRTGNNGYCSWIVYNRPISQARSPRWRVTPAGIWK